MALLSVLLMCDVVLWSAAVSSGNLFFYLMAIYFVDRFIYYSIY